MNGLANWKVVIKGLGLCFAAVFFSKLYLTGAAPVPAVHSSFKAIYEATGVALTITGALFFIFTKWGWRLSILRKLDVIRFPDFSGTWHATSYPAEWDPFRTVVVIRHSFYKFQMTLVRNESTGKTTAAMLVRTDTDTVRIYATYYSYVGPSRALLGIPAVEHGEDHTGALWLDLNDESLDPSARMLTGQYWTNKRRTRSDDRSRGTWGRIEMQFQRREPAAQDARKLESEDRNWLVEERIKTEVTERAT